MRALVSVTLALALTSVSFGAHAQDATDEDALARAVILFEESEQLYNDGELAQAAALLRRAYALHPNPTLLFNLARSLEGLGELDEAIETYERYLAEGEDIEDRGAIERRVETLRAQRDRLTAAATPDAHDVPDPAPTPPSSSASTGGGIDPAPWIVLGLGAATLGVGVVFGVLSQDEASAAAAEPVQRTAVARHADAETYAIVANVLFAVGGAAALAGAIWGIVTLVDGDGEEARVEAAPTPGGVLVRGAF